MERKLRNRINKNDTKLIMIKLLPIIFLILLYLAASSIGVANAVNGPLMPGAD